MRLLTNKCELTQGNRARHFVVRLGCFIFKVALNYFSERGKSLNGYIHSYESFGTVDGPGIRFVLFMQGCPMRCLYCHNPDTWTAGAGREISAEEAAKIILKYKSYISDGGVTVSGGEPLLQTEFVTELFKILKREGIHTALDTSGVTFNADSPESVARHAGLLKYTDLVLLDIKHIDGNEHKKLTGCTNKNVLDFAKYLSDTGKDTWIRHVLVTGITDDDGYLKELRAFIDGLKTVRKVEVLPYHSMGEAKYAKLGLEYKLKGLTPPEKSRVLNAESILGAKR